MMHGDLIAEAARAEHELRLERSARHSAQPRFRQQLGSFLIRWGEALAGPNSRQPALMSRT